MTHHPTETEAALLDALIDALLENPDTPAPVSLDPDLVALARQIVASRTPFRTAPQGAWSHIVASARHARPQLPSHPAMEGYQNMQNATFARNGIAQNSRQTNWLTLIAVAATVALVFGLLIVRGTFQRGPELSPSTQAIVMQGPAPESPPRQDDQLIVIGDTVISTLTEEQPFATYYFLGQAGQMVDIMFSAEQPVQFSHNFVNLPKVGLNQGGGGGGGGSPSDELVLSLPFELDSRVEITITSTPANNLPVNFSLSVSATDPTLLNDGETAQGHLTPEHPTQFFEFEAQRGDIISLWFEGDPALDLSMTLTDASDDRLVANDDDSGLGYLPELLNVQLPHSGTYRVRVETVSPLETETDFGLTLRMIQAVVLDSTRATLSWPPKQDAHIARFDGHAGETVKLSLSRPEAMYLVGVSVFQNDKEIASGQMDQELDAVLEFTIPEDGPVLVALSRQHLSNRPLDVIPMPFTLILDRVNP